MGLHNGYSLLVGKFEKYVSRSGRNSNHSHLTVRVGDTSYDTAINVYSNTSEHLEYYYDPNYTYNQDVINALQKMELGKYNKNDGALSKILQLDYSSGTLFPRGRMTSCSNDSVIECRALDNVLIDLFRNEHKTDGCKNCVVYVFGEPYTNGNGMHNIHRNDWSRGKYSSENGKSQDGALFVRKSNGSYAAYFSQFKTR